MEVNSVFVSLLLGFDDKPTFKLLLKQMHFCQLIQVLAEKIYFSP